MSTSRPPDPNPMAIEDDLSFPEIGPCEDADALALAEGSAVHIVDVDEYEAKWKETKSFVGSGGNYAAALAQVYERCSGLRRPKHLGMAPADPKDHFGALAASYPNARELFTLFEEGSYGALVRESHELSGLRILLIGPPGTGKTAAVTKLAESLTIHCERLSMNALATSHELLGLGRTWSNPTPGALAKLMNRSVSANPIVILDELDKGATAAGPYGRSLDSLRELTEPETSKAVHDQCLDIDINMSRVSFVATANSTDTLSEPLLSRFQVIEIRRPTRNEMPALLQSLYRSVLGRDLGKFSVRLPDALVERLLSDTPRSARLRIERAVNRAAKRAVGSGATRRGRIVLLPEDLPGNAAKPERMIGFVQAT